ncbi:MAG: DUF5615 family PIN-like protein [Chloroflexia bacterium]
MKFKLDENLPLEVAVMLRSAGYDALTVHDQNMRGERDERVIDACKYEERVLMTLDLDFADMRAFPPDQYSGIIVLRVRSQDVPHLVSVCSGILPVLSQEQVKQRLWIVDEARIRIRGE